MTSIARFDSVADRERWVSVAEAADQERVDMKSNEIFAVPFPMERLGLKGAVVTSNPTKTQTKIADIIVRRGGGYLLAPKEN